MASGGQEAPCFRRYPAGRELVSKPAIFVEEKLGGATVEPFYYSVVILRACLLQD